MIRTVVYTYIRSGKVPPLSRLTSCQKFRDGRKNNWKISSVSWKQCL